MLKFLLILLSSVGKLFKVLILQRLIFKSLGPWLHPSYLLSCFLKLLLQSINHVLKLISRSFIVHLDFVLNHLDSLSKSERSDWLLKILWVWGACDYQGRLKISSKRFFQNSCELWVSVRNEFLFLRKLVYDFT